MSTYDGRTFHVTQRAKQQRGQSTAPPARGDRGRAENSNTLGKLALRRHFLRAYHVASTSSSGNVTRPKVLDCCQADMELWRVLREEFKVHYWGVDRVAKPGRLAIDSTRLLATSPLPYDVIDVDTYGSPWYHWHTLLPNVRKPTTVFLTIGFAGPMRSDDNVTLDALGLSKMRVRPPKSLCWKLDELAIGACLALAKRQALTIVEAVEVMPPAKNARYFGVHLRPA